MRLIIGISFKLIVRQEYNTTIAFSYIYLHSNIEHRTVRAGLKTLYGHINRVSNYCAHSGQWRYPVTGIFLSQYNYKQPSDVNKEQSPKLDLREFVTLWEILMSASNLYTNYGLLRTILDALI